MKVAMAQQAGESQGTAFVVMARFSDDRDDESPVKTRLARVVGKETARDLYRVVLGETMRAAEHASAALGGAHLWLAWDQPPPEGTAESAGWRALVQQGEGLGQRLADVFERLFSRGYERVLILASDVPALPVSYLARAVLETVDRQVVIGPCLDGGYYLISTSKHVWCDWGEAIQTVLTSVPTGTTSTCEQTVRALNQSGLVVNLLGAWIDIDEETDLPLASRLSEGIAQNLLRTPHVAEAAIPSLNPGGPAKVLSTERGQPLAELAEVYLHLTNDCEGRCLHCYKVDGPFMGDHGKTISGHMDKRELTFAELCSVADEAVSLGAQSFVIIGGDPLHKDCLLPLLDHLTGERSCTVRVFLGRLPRPHPESIVAGLAEAGHGRLIPMVSLEGPEEINDRIRGKGSFSQSTRLIKLLKNVGLDPFVNTVLLKPCLAALPSLPATLVELGVRRMHLILPHQLGRARRAHELIPTGQEIFPAVRALQQSAAAQGVTVDNFNAFRARLSKPRDLCNAGCSLLAIDPHGSVYPCPITVGDPAFAAGNVRADTLASIWRASPVLRLVRSAHTVDRRNCRDCDVVNACGGECWVQAHYAARAAGSRAGFGASFPYCDFVRPLLRELFDELKQSGGTEDVAQADLTPFECT